MKKLIITSVFAVMTSVMTLVNAQNQPEEYLGLPGDNLNLYAVMNLFQEAETLEGFERNLNDENSTINNLDLNGDNLVDYITVSDYLDGDVHNIVLRAALGREEYQDVAVFTVQKFSNGAVQIQLIGDEALYGRNYIIEPNYAETPNPGYIGKPANRANATVVTTTHYEIATWPLIRYIYRPGYTVWRSSWYWGYYPVYWNPWRPYYWHYYYGYHYNWNPHYYRHYRHYAHYRYPGYNDFYYSRIRAYSPVVVVNINRGNYKSTYSRPELRREGEALYTRTRASQSTGTRNSDVVNNQPGRSTESITTRNRSASDVNGGIEKRSTTTSDSRTRSRTVPGQDSPAVRTPGSTENRKSEARPANVQGSETPRRSSATVNNKEVSTRTQSRNPANVRSTTNTKNNPAVRTAPARSSTSSREPSVSTAPGSVRKETSVKSSPASRGGTPVTPSRTKVQQSAPVRTKSVQSATPARSPAVQSSAPSRTPAVQRSAPAKNTAVQKSAPTRTSPSQKSVSSGSSARQSAPAVRSSNQRSNSSAKAQKSSNSGKVSSSRESRR